MQRSVLVTLSICAIVWLEVWRLRSSSSSPVGYKRGLVLLAAGGRALRFPRGIACDRQGFIYLSDTENERIVKIDPDGRTVWSRGRLGRSPGEFDNPAGIAVSPTGAVYVANADDNRIDQLESQNGAFVRTLVDPVPQPCGLALATNGDLWVSPGDLTLGRYRVLRFGPDGASRPSVGHLLNSGSVAAGPTEAGIVGSTYRSSNVLLQRFSLPETLPAGDLPLREIQSPTSAAYGPDGRLAVGDDSPPRIVLYRNGRAIGLIPEEALSTPRNGGGDRIPTALAFDPQGRLWAATRRALLRFDPLP